MILINIKQLENKIATKDIPVNNNINFIVIQNITSNSEIEPEVTVNDSELKPEQSAIQDKNYNINFIVIKNVIDK